jgi:hypothetical protein
MWSAEVTINQISFLGLSNHRKAHDQFKNHEWLSTGNHSHHDMGVMAHVQAK